MTYCFHVSYNLYAQIHLFDDRKLASGHIYEITGFDLFVIVKYLQSTNNSKTCTCSPVMYRRSSCMHCAQTIRTFSTVLLPA